MNRTALVTGASRGIGQSISEQLLSDGWTVHGTYNTGRQEAEQLSAQWRELTMHQIDFADRHATTAFIQSIQWLQLDGLVNNAGIFAMENFVNFDMNLWDRILDVNVRAPLQLTVALQKNLRPNSAVVNIASIDGLVGSFASVSYSASKAALINLTKSLGNNLGRLGIRVNALAPGWIDTGTPSEESLQAVEEITPLRRNGRPEDVAKVVRFLLSVDASFINGETIIMDGGFSNVDYIMLQEAKQTA